MTDDAMALFRAARPQAPPVSSEAIRAPTSNRSRELHGLAMVPGQPGYNERIPKPACFQCGDDHFPGKSYDHEWQPEPVTYHDEPVSASPSFRRPEVIEQVIEARVALYVGRGDTYVVAIETPPDWDAETSFKVEPVDVLLLVNMARALGVKIMDKTGGDLMMLEQEYAGQHAQNNGRSTQTVRGDSPRRPGPEPDGPSESVAGGALPPPGSVH